MDGSSGNSRHNSIKAHALLRLSVARACDLVRLAACHAFENEADPGRAELRRSQVQLREEWRAAYSGFPSAVPPVGIAGDDSDPHRGQGKQPELLHKAKAPLEMSTDAPASVSLARQLLRSAKSLKGLHEATSMTETSDNSTAQVAANSQAEINLIAEIRIAWALIDRTIVAPLEALVDRLDPPEPSSFDVDASTTLPPRLRPAAVLSPPAAPSINLSSTMQLPLRPHVAPGALVAVGAEAVRRRLQLFLMDQHQAQVAVAQAGAVLQRVLRMWCAKRRAAQRALQVKQAGAILARWCEDLWPKHMARTQAAQARRQVAAAKVQRWCVRHWRVAASKRQVVEPSTQLWFVSRVPVAGNAAKQAVAMAGRRLVRLQAFWRGAVARQRFAPSRSSKRLPAQLMGLPGAPSLMSTIPSARSPLAMALEAIGAGNVGAHHGAPSSIQGWVKRQARLQRAWQVDEALVAGRCAQDAGAAAAQAAVAELEAHVASSLQAWTVEMRKVVLAEPVNDREWLMLAETRPDYSNSDNSSSSSSSSSSKNTSKNRGGGDSGGPWWTNLKTGETQQQHPHAKHCDRNQSLAQQAARQQVLDGVRAIEAQAAAEAQVFAEAEPIRLQEREEVWWRDASGMT